MTAHALFSPSSSERWLRCPACVWLERKAEAEKPSEQGDAAREGTERHAVLERLLTAYYKGGGKAVPAPDATDSFALAAYNAITGRFQERRKHAAFIERTVNCEGAPGEFADNSCWGTLDFGYLEGRTLHIVDAKFGRIPVSPESPQLKCYALGLLREVEADDVMLHIIQPTVSHKLRTAYFPEHEREAFAAQIGMSLDTARGVAGNPEAACNAGEHCTWCKGKRLCAAYERGALNALATAFDASDGYLAEGVPPIDPPDTATLADAYEWGKGVEKAVKEINALMREKVEAGQVPGYAMKQLRAGASTWADKVSYLDVAQALGCKLQDVVMLMPVSKVVSKYKDSAHVLSDMIVKAEPVMTISKTL